MRKDYDFEDYAMKMFMKGNILAGSFWEHLNVSNQHTLYKLKNLMISFYRQ